ncbi:hypothetical protein BE11_37980 [Sorangium cellulosum]|nr:hypothetical protein BE11_37980 [Sorangium cellulosum]
MTCAMTMSPPRRLAPAPVERACRCAWDEASSATLDPAEQAALAALSRWLDEPELPYAILHGPRPSRRSVVAAHLVRAQHEGTAYAAQLVPLGPDLRLDRDLIALLVSRLLADYGRSREIDARFCGLHLSDAGVSVQQGPSVNDMGAIAALDEELEQSDRFLSPED